VDLTSRLRSIVRGTGPRELTYEPDNGSYRATLDLDRVCDMLGGRVVTTRFGPCLVIDRRYESDRWHGDIKIEDCEVQNVDELMLLDPELFGPRTPASALRATAGKPDPGSRPPDSGTRTPDPGPRQRRTLFIDLETTGLSGGAGTIAFLVGCGYFDVGAFQVRQFLLTSHRAERALLAAVAEFFEEADLIVTYNGKTFDLPVMETRWLFHRMEPPLEGVPHFDMLHPARRLWKGRAATHKPAFSAPSDTDGCCRLTTLERTLFDVERVGDVEGFEIPGRFFRFVRSGDARPLEPVLEHNRLDLVSLAAVTSRAARLAKEGPDACRDCAEALALGRVYDRAGRADRAEACYRRASDAEAIDVKAEALYHLGLRYRRDRRFEDAAAIWRALLAECDALPRARRRPLADLRQFAAEALAIHLEHRRRDFTGAREHALVVLEDSEGGRADGVRHRLARLERKIDRLRQGSGGQAQKQNAQLFPS
jgi:uncharacterized protein YprB with RNaseH-like and TPR domain